MPDALVGFACMVSGVFSTSQLLERLVNSRTRAVEISGREAVTRVADLSTLIRSFRSSPKGSESVRELGVVPKGHPVLEALDPLVVQLDARSEKGLRTR